jgi:hypothetical protein
VIQKSSSGIKAGSDIDEDEQAIIDAAWLKSRDNVFKKKRNSMVGQKSKEIGDITLQKLEEIDEKEESQRICIEDLEVTPLKKNKNDPIEPMSASGYFTQGMHSSRDFRTSILDT